MQPDSQTDKHTHAQVRVPDLDPNCFQRLPADDSHHKIIRLYLN